MAETVTTKILSDALHEAIGGRRVKVAVFTTFAFEPGFFEEEVLPILFEQSFSHVPKLRLIQLEEALRSVDHAAVYYDRNALVTGGPSAALDVRRIPLSQGTGYFHPKVILLLVEEKQEPRNASLVVAVMSANLTRAGWWENVECATVLEASDGSRCSFRRDLLKLIHWIKRDESAGDQHAALEAIRRFVHHRLSDETNRSAQRILRPRIFTGEQSLTDFLKESLRKLPGGTYNLEVISPYFDGTGDASTIEEIIDWLAPKETRVYLPQASDGAARCREDFFDAVESLDGARWGKLSRPLVLRGKAESDDQTDRFVHAKVYRIWSRLEGREYILSGSVNLTRAAHSKAAAGNLEAAILLDLGPGRSPQFWLEAIENRPALFRVEETEEPGREAAPPPVSICYHWDENRAEYFWEGGERATPQRAVFSSAGANKFELSRIIFDEWTQLPPEISGMFSDILKHSSFLDARVDGEDRGTILIREEGMALKPSILLSLSAEEILHYWSLLSPEQREAFLSDRARALLVSEEVMAKRADSPAATQSLFDRFAGIFHAFSRLGEHVSDAIEQKRESEAVYRLFGRKYDSLPSLVERVIKEEDGDPVNRYVTLLTAKQFLRRMRREHREFFEGHRQEERKLLAELDSIEQVRKRLDLGSDEEAEKFFKWFEHAFLQEARPREQA